MAEEIINIEKYKPIFPMVYLGIGVVIVIVCKVFEIPDSITGLLVDAALTRVKVPAPNGK